MMDRTWLTKRVSSIYLGADGGIVSPTITTSSEDEWHCTEEGFKDLLRQDMLFLERKGEFATVRFSYKDSHPEYRIAAYRVDWNGWHYRGPSCESYHENELYYVLLDMDLVNYDVITEVLGNRAYLQSPRKTVGILNVLSEYGGLKDKFGRYTTVPAPMLWEVASAIGLKELESKDVIVPDDIPINGKQTYYECYHCRQIRLGEEDRGCGVCDCR